MRYIKTIILIHAISCMALATIAEGSQNINYPPEILPIDSIVAQETNVVHFVVHATDSNMVVPILMASGLPDSAVFIDNQDFSGTFHWPTDYDDEGVYDVTFYAIDGEDTTLVDSIVVQITILNTNRPPWVLEWPPRQNIIVNEGDTLFFQVLGYDQDGPIPILSAGWEYSHNGGTLNFDFTDSLNGFGVLTITPNHSQSGLHVFYFVAHDSDPRYPTDSSRAPTQNFIVNDVPVCGDANYDGMINIADAVYLLVYIFYLVTEPPDMWTADCNDDGLVNGSDATLLINYTFRAGPAPTCAAVK